MSSLVIDTGDACGEESILPEVEELEFHPDELSRIGDIQEELEKLEANEKKIGVVTSPAVDVNVVDHEVTIIAEQANEESSILPEFPGTALSQNTIEKTSISKPIKTSSNVEDKHNPPKPIFNLIKDPGLSSVTKSTTANSSGNQSVTKSNVTTVPARQTINMSNLKLIRPLPEGVQSKKSLFTLNQQKKNVLTKVIFTPNSQVSSDAPIIFGEAGGQTIRLVGQSKAIITSSGSTKAITFAQAKEMGLLSPGKMHILPSQPKGLKKSTMMGSNKTLTMVKSSPTKILPLPTTGHLQPIAPSPTVNTLTPTHKILIHQSPSAVKPGNFSGTLLNSSVGSSGHILQLPVSQANSQIHQIHLPGKQVQYVRLVNTVTTNTTTVPLETITKSEPVLMTPPNTPKPVPVALLSSKTVPNPYHVKMVKASSSSVDSKMSLSTSKPLSSTAIAEHSSSSSSPPSPPLRSRSPSSPSIFPTSKTKEPGSVPFFTNFTPKTKTPIEPPNGIRPRKPCNCTKSQCLKLYCDCFANGEFCFQCNCNCCYNNLDHEEERQKAIKACLERNPNAFRPKIGKGYVGDERRHNKGCNCKRSGCLKNYCECYEAKIPCSNNCKCVGCRNIEELRDNQDKCTVEVNKMNQQFSAKAKLTHEIQENSNKPNMYISNQTARQPSNLMTQEVVEATCQCLLAQSESKGKLTEDVEKLILEEFGRCLVEIIDYATRTAVPDST